MRAYLSSDSAYKRLASCRAQRLSSGEGLRFEELCQYLEDVSPEPSGREAYELALALRKMNLGESEFHRLLADAHHQLERLRSISKHEMEGMLESLGKLGSKCHSHFENQKAADETNIPAVQSSPASDRSSHESIDVERVASFDGDWISRSIRRNYKLRLFHQMVLLALSWVFSDPSSDPSQDERVWIEEDTVRLFP